MAEVRLQGVGKAFGTVEVLRDVDLAVRSGEFVVFVGPSGCGKSTLLRLIAGLEDVSAGDILIDGAVVTHRTPKERGIAMVFQSYALYPHMSVYDNMAFGLEMSKMRREHIDERVRRTAALLQIEPLLERKPRELSGGQRQRVAIGRAMVREPKVFLFDEPLSNLDAALRVQTRIEIAGLHRRSRATMIYVTHDQVEAMTLADRIVVLNRGKVEQVGEPLELYHRPANRFVAGFIGSPQMNFLSSRIVEVGPDSVTVTLVGGASIAVPALRGAGNPGDAVTLGVRPEHLAIGRGDVGMQGEVELVEQLGDVHLLYVRIADGSLLTIRGGGQATNAIGDTLVVNVPPEQCHLFDEAGSAFARRPAR